MEQKGQHSKTNEQITLTLFSAKTYNSKDPRQQSITSALTSFVANDLMPLSIVESDSFRDLVQCLDPRYQVPSRKHMSSVLLKERHGQLLAIIKDGLQDVHSVSVTMDLWLFLESLLIIYSIGS